MTLKHFAALWSLLLLIIWSATYADNPDSRELDRSFERTTVQIATPDARVHSFQMWVADQESQRQRGLMFIKQLDDDRGMLFIFGKNQPISMWMKNTYVSLDMLFVAQGGQIIKVAEHTQPLSEKTIGSGQAVIAVIELKGGTAARLKIGAGARVLLPQQ